MFLTVALFILTGLSFISVTAFAFAQRKEIAKAIAKWAALPLFVVLIFYGEAWTFLQQWSVTKKVEKIFEKEDYVLYVKSQALDNKEDFKRDFMNRKNTKMSGSSPVKPIRVRIAGETEEITLLFWRDSRDENFYWVEFPKFEYSASLFYVETEILDDF